MGPRVHISYDRALMAETDRLVRLCEWHYQTLDPNDEDLHGVIRHIPSGAAFLTALDRDQTVDPMIDFHMARLLFAPDEDPAVGLDARIHLARAAAHVAEFAELSGGGSLHMPAASNGFSHEVEPLPARPFVAAVTAEGFLLDP
jgi:hypothetical protein